MERIMGFFDVVPPYAVILVGALLVALGTYAAGTRQSRNAAHMKGDITTAVTFSATSPRKVATRSWCSKPSTCARRRSNLTAIFALLR